MLKAINGLHAWKFDQRVRTTLLGFAIEDWHLLIWPGFVVVHLAILNLVFEIIGKAFGLLNC